MTYRFGQMESVDDIPYGSPDLRNIIESGMGHINYHLHRGYQTGFSKKEFDESMRIIYIIGTDIKRVLRGKPPISPKSALLHN